MASPYDLQSDFDTAVLERSHERPVLVDFWAAWCQPCRLLGPVLESLAETAGDQWDFVKVDTEAHPEIAQRFRIQGIPAVKLFHRGEEIAEFTGALPEPQVQMWLQQNLPSPVDDVLQRAEAARDAGGRAAAMAAYQEALSMDPNRDDARLELGKLLLDSDPAAAAEMLERITGDAVAYESAQHLLHLIHVTEHARDLTDDPANEAVALYREAARAFTAGDHAKALQSWIEVIERDRALDDDGARRACIALFALLGEEHPLTQEYRRRFSMALSI